MSNRDLKPTHGEPTQTNRDHCGTFSCDYGLLGLLGLGRLQIHGGI